MENSPLVKEVGETCVRAVLVGEREVLAKRQAGWQADTERERERDRRASLKTFGKTKAAAYLLYIRCPWGRLAHCARGTAGRPVLKTFSVGPNSLFTLLKGRVGSKMSQEPKVGS